MKKFLAVIVFLAAIALAIYVGGWLLFIKPILVACSAYDAGTLTAMTIGITIIKCVFASGVAGIIMWLGSTISAILAAL